MLSPVPPTDAALVQAARDGDQAAWSALVERYDRVIVSISRAHRLGHHDVDDVRQTTWLRAVEHLDRLQDPERIGAWLATVARRESLRLLRAAGRVRPCDHKTLEREPDISPPPDVRVLASERREAVRGAVSSLPRRDRTLLGMLFGEAEPSYADIGRTLKMPVGSIGPTRGRVLERLRRQEPLADLVI